jgi:excisionase family DNA binding protein
MASPQAPLHPIRPSEAEAWEISELRATLQHWFITMPEAARREAATAGPTSTWKATPQEDDTAQYEPSEETPPWTWSAFALRLPDGAHLNLPTSIARGLFVMLSALEEGDAVTVVPMGADLTTQEAANLLGVSRPYLIRLINQGLIPCEWVGKHRRIRLQDILAYRRSRQASQRGALRQLTEETESAGLRYSDDE